MSLSRPRIRLILDFDGTITTDDTTAIIGSRCLAKARELAPSGVTDDQLPKSMQYYSEQYMHEYKEWKKSLPPASEPETIADEVLRLSQSKHVEQNSFMRVRNAVLGVPGGIGDLPRNETARDEFMIDAGRQAIRSGEVHIRDPESLQELITKTETESNIWGIVSVSWSRGFILGVLLESGMVSEGVEAVAKRIKCNELLAPNHVDEVGNLDIISSALDKQSALYQLLEESAVLRSKRSLGSKDDDTPLTIYIGDSSTDIGCLANADVGMYLHQGEPEQDSVLQTLESLHVDVLHTTDLPTSNVPLGLSNRTTMLRSKRRPQSIICSISSFGEVNDWLSKITSETH